MPNKSLQNALADIALKDSTGRAVRSESLIVVGTEEGLGRFAEEFSKAVAAEIRTPTHKELVAEAELIVNPKDFEALPGVEDTTSNYPQPLVEPSVGNPPSEPATAQALESMARGMAQSMMDGSNSKGDQVLAEGMAHFTAASIAQAQADAVQIAAMTEGEGGVAESLALLARVQELRGQDVSVPEGAPATFESSQAELSKIVDALPDPEALTTAYERLQAAAEGTATPTDLEALKEDAVKLRQEYGEQAQAAAEKLEQFADAAKSPDKESAKVELDKAQESMDALVNSVARTAETVLDENKDSLSRTAFVMTDNLEKTMEGASKELGNDAAKETDAGAGMRQGQMLKAAASFVRKEGVSSSFDRTEDSKAVDRSSARTVDDGSTSLSVSTSNSEGMSEKSGTFHDGASSRSSEQPSARSSKGESSNVSVGISAETKDASQASRESSGAEVKETTRASVDSAAIRGGVKGQDLSDVRSGSSRDSSTSKGLSSSASVGLSTSAAQHQSSHSRNENMGRSGSLTDSAGQSKGSSGQQSVSHAGVSEATSANEAGSKGNAKEGSSSRAQGDSEGSSASGNSKGAGKENLKATVEGTVGVSAETRGHDGRAEHNDKAKESAESKANLQGLLDGLQMDSGSNRKSALEGARGTALEAGLAGGAGDWDHEDSSAQKSKDGGRQDRAAGEAFAGVQSDQRSSANHREDAEVAAHAKEAVEREMSAE
ncbi:hypothetical protein LC612_32495 [Nostoc sp. CHAB 5834]|nr:hypothetical protein [Nostoc sp. CHAB 5834]